MRTRFASVVKRQKEFNVKNLRYGHRGAFEKTRLAGIFRRPRLAVCAFGLKNYR